jgi:uncharacterized RDD family membrane protein YckC
MAGPRALAGRDERVLAAMADAVIFAVLWALAAFATGALTLAGGPFGWNPAGANALAMLGYYLLQGYPLLTQGQTVGKQMQDISIVDAETGRLASWPRVAARCLVAHLPLWIPWVGVLWAVIDSLAMLRGDRRCLHDLATGTRVVRGATLG